MGPITIRELIDEYSSDITVLIFLIQQEPYEISEADKTQSIIANNKEPSIDNTPRAITYCRDCCRKKILGEPPKSYCPKGSIPPLNPHWRMIIKPIPNQQGIRSILIVVILTRLHLTRHLQVYADTMTPIGNPVRAWTLNMFKK